jgi:cell division protease FtsH
MVPELGNVTYDPDPPSFMGAPPSPFGPRREISDDTTRRIDAAVQAIVQGCFARAERVLADNRGLLEEGAGLLLQKETLGPADLEPLFARVEKRGAEITTDGHVPGAAPQPSATGSRPLA